MEKKKFDINIWAKKLGKNLIYILIAGLAAAYGDNQLYLAVAPLIAAVENWLKYK